MHNKPQAGRSDRAWTAEQVLELGRSYQAAAVLAAAAELEIFTPLKQGPQTAGQLARKLPADPRALAALLDAMTALKLLEKRASRYSLAAGIEPLLTPESPQTVLAMAQHQANCLRNWAQLAKVVKTGRPAERLASVRGESGDQESFIGAMHNISWPNAPQVIQAIQPLKFVHLLDIGGASGTWTMAFLRACPGSRATLFDLPHVIPMAKRRLNEAGLAERVSFIPGDFYHDPLPPGADLAWVSAIVHQNSREQNRALFAAVHSALLPAGRVAIRDIIMEPDRTAPPAGALFAINMLVATQGGATFTLEELSEDLGRSGFAGATLVRRDPAMNAVVVAHKK